MIFITITGCTFNNELPVGNESALNEEITTNTVSESEETITEETEAFLSQEITVSEFNELPDDIKMMYDEVLYDRDERLDVSVMQDVIDFYNQSIIREYE